MLRKEKEEFVRWLKDEIKDAKSIVFAENQGLTVSEMYQLRKEIRLNRVNFRIIKNRLAKIAISNLGLKDYEKFLKGPVGIAYSQEDPVMTAKLVYEFSKRVPKLKIKGGIIEGLIVERDGVEQIARLPGREELILRLLYLLSWPAQGLVNVLTASVRNLLSLLNAIQRR
ncbi:MAG: 50S ribosomal protein L10 [Candidatus Hydrogenedentota bacterium]